MLLAILVAVCASLVLVVVLVALQHFLTQYRLDIHGLGRRLQGLLWEDAKRERLVARAVGSSKQRPEALQVHAPRQGLPVRRTQRVSTAAWAIEAILVAESASLPMT